MLWIAVALGGTVSDGADVLAQGAPDAAIQIWEPAAANGWGSGKLKFNLGNAYYRKGDLPRAIAYWRAAGVLRPRTSGVNHNLALARSELSGVPSPVGTPALWLQILTPGELGLVGLLLATLGSALVVWRRRTQTSRLPGFGLWLLGSGLVALSMWGWWMQRMSPVAVVVDQEAIVRDAPDLEARTRFLLSPGAEVRVVDELGPFRLVETGEGKRGWMADGALFQVPR
jgi:tetratricopeptide (TPR) repeat protein